MSYSIAIQFLSDDNGSLSVILGNNTGTHVVVELRDPTVEQHVIKRIVLTSADKAKVINFSSRGTNRVPSIHFWPIVE